MAVYVSALGHPGGMGRALRRIHKGQCMRHPRHSAKGKREKTPHPNSPPPLPAPRGGGRAELNFSFCCDEAGCAGAVWSIVNRPSSMQKPQARKIQPTTLGASFPRKRESSRDVIWARFWIPACAGMTAIGWASPIFINFRGPKAHGDRVENSWVAHTLVFMYAP